MITPPDKFYALGEAVTALKKAQSVYDEVYTNLAEAKRLEHEALCVLNEAQKAFDRASEGVREKPSLMSEWHRSKKNVGN